MKKVLVFLTVTIVLLMCLVACNQGQPQKPTPEHTHEFGEWDLTAKPTCTENGTKVRYCSCGEKQTETVVSLGHTPDEAKVEDRVEPTYDADGSYKNVVRCSACGEKLSETSHTIPMLKHTPAEAVTENVVDATCYSLGSYDTVIYCSDCGAELERATNTTSMIEHTPAAAVEEDRVNPTYEQDGSYQMVVYCSVSKCHAELERTTYILDTLVHHPGNVVIENNIAPSCTQTGSYDEVVYCLDADCGYKELSRSTITLQKLAHTPANAVIENKVNATCTVDGSYDEVVYCSVENCKAQISRTSKVITATGHTFGEWITVKEATTTEEGLKERYCTCGEKETQTIDKLIVYHEGIKYTTNADGTKSVIIGDDVTLINYGWFEYETSLTSVTICNKETMILGFAFYGCTALSNVFFAGTEDEWSEMVIYYNYELVDSHIYYYSATEPTTDGNYWRWVNDAPVAWSEYVTPTYSQGLKYTSNGDGTCILSGIGNCVDVNVIIPSISPSGEMVTSIGNRVFYYDPDYNPPTGDQCVLSASRRIESVTIPSNITSIGYEAFAGCDVLTDVYYLGSAEDWNKISIDALNSPLTNATIHYNDIPESEVYSQGLSFTSNGDGTCYVSEIGSCTDTDIVIPPTSPAGDRVTSIGEMAFKDCASLESIIIPDSVTSIGDEAFSCMPSLTKIYIGSGVEHINASMFEECMELCNITVNENNPTYYSSGNCVIERATKALVLGGTKCLIPDNVTTIYSFAFSGRYSLYSIIIPSSVTEIQEYAFDHCEGLKSVIISDGITKIENHTFNQCTSLESIEIPETVEHIGSYAFYYCSSLSSIKIPDSVTSIGSYAFYYCSSLTSIKIPDSVTSIGISAFQKCDSLECVTFAEDSLLEYIGSWAFLGCTSLESITIPATLTTIDSGAFKKCTSLVSVTFAEGSQLSYIGDGAYYGCTSLANVELPSSVKTIDSNAFCECTSLTSIKIPGGVTTIGQFAFNNCTSLASVTFSEGVTTTGFNAFSSCTALTNVEFPSSLETINGMVFYNCTSLKSVTFAENSRLKTIETSAFNRCVSLEKIVIPASVTYIGGSAFSQCTVLASVTFENPEGWCRENYDSTSTYSILSTSLANTSTAATYLKSTYVAYNWKRSE